MQPLHIVMIDDNQGDLQLLEEAFTDCRMTVSFHGFLNYHQAKDHLDRLHASQARLPDLVIIDLSLPVVSGEMIVAAIRSVEAMRTIPLIVMSGLIREAIAERLLSSGVSRVVLKPKSYEEYLTLAASLQDFSATRERPAI